MILNRGSRNEFLRYALAVAGYVVLGLFTKRYLTWTWGPIYFMTVLEVLPRCFRRVRSWVVRSSDTEPARTS